MLIWQWFKFGQYLEFVRMNNYIGFRYFGWIGNKENSVGDFFPSLIQNNRLNSKYLFIPNKFSFV